MSMPVISTPASPISMYQAIADLLESIALQETAMSHIINAEGEKIQFVLSRECISFDDLMTTNESVTNTLGAITDLEKTLRDKLEFISNNLYYPSQEA